MGAGLSLQTVRPVRVRKAGGELSEGLVWVEVYLPFDVEAWSGFQALVTKHGGDLVKAEAADPVLASKALTPIDAHGEAMTADDLQQLAHGFLVSSRKIDVMHDQAARASVQVVESFRNTEEIASPNFYPGAWVLCLKVAPGSDEWKALEGGTLDAVSFETTVVKVPRAARPEAA